MRAHRHSGHQQLWTRPSVAEAAADFGSVEARQRTGDDSITHWTPRNTFGVRGFIHKPHTEEFWFYAFLDAPRSTGRVVRYALPQRAAQRATMSDEQLARQARQLGLRTPAQAARGLVWCLTAPACAIACRYPGLTPGLVDAVSLAFRGSTRSDSGSGK